MLNVFNKALPYLIIIIIIIIINTFKHANFIKSSLWRVHYGGAPQQIKLTS